MYKSEVRTVGGVEADLKAPGTTKDATPEPKQVKPKRKKIKKKYNYLTITPDELDEIRI